MDWQKNEKILPEMAGDLTALYKKAGNLLAPALNAAFVVAQATSNGQGNGGPTTVALVSTVAKVSGRFMWWAAASQNTAAATEVNTMTVTSQTGTGPVTMTGNGAATIGNGFFASGVAGTGIVLTGGGGTGFGISSQTHNIGTGGQGTSFATGGLLMQNDNTHYPIGNNVILQLQWTNSANNRIVSNISLALIELPG